MNPFLRYILNSLILLDLALNALFAGSPYETCSSRLGRHYDTNKAARIFADCINWVFKKCFGQENHCLISIQSLEFYKGKEVL